VTSVTSVAGVTKPFVNSLVALPVANKYQIC